MVRLERLTGARPGEIIQMRPMEINRSGDVWLYKPETHKTQHHGRARIMAIGPQAQKVLVPIILATFCILVKSSG